MSFRQSGLALATLAVAVSSCSYGGGDIGNPLRPKVQWYSYVQGDDIRSTCDAYSPDRYRLIYNGIYLQQLRMYQLDSATRTLVIRVATPGDTSRWSLNDPLGPWRAGEDRVILDQQSYDQMVVSFTESGMFGPPAVGLSLPARSYFWTAAFCKKGRFGFTAWAYPEASQRVTFDGLLFPIDPSHTPVAMPGPVPYDPIWESDKSRGRVQDFTLKVTADGLQ